MAEQIAITKKRGRSPGYPAIGLEEAIRLARLVYDHEGRNAAPIDSIVEDWGMKATSGWGWAVVSALLKYGLLADEGKATTRKAKLTELGLDIVLDVREDGSQRQQRIQEAALKPTIHADLWKKFGPNLPSDGTLRYYLEREKGFNPAAVPDLIKQFRQTVAFAKLTESDRLMADEAITATESSSESEAEAPEAPFQVAPVIAATAVETPDRIQSKLELNKPTTRVVNLPLSGAAWAALQVPYPMSEDDWNQMLAVLNAMKPGIVTSATPKPASEADLPS